MTDIGPLISFAIILIAGLVGGELMARMRLPRVTGWIVTGVILRAFDMSVFNPDRLSQFKPFSDLVLGYIAFTVGSHLHFRSLINAQRRLMLLVLTEAIITPFVVVVFMCKLGGLSLDHGLLFAAIATAGAPGTTVLVIREARARGVFVKTLIAAVALIDMVAVCLFVVVEEELHASHGLTLAFIAHALPAVARTLVIAMVAGLVSAGVAMLLVRRLVGRALLGVTLVAAILLAWGLAEWLDVSSILAVTFLGILLTNLAEDKERVGEAYLNTFSSLLFTAFFTLAGLRLDFSHVVPMAGLVALFFSGRLFGKSLSAFVAMSFAKAPHRIRRFLGPALLPHGGVAVGLIIIVQTDPYLTEYSDTVLAVGLAALAINQFIGPSAVRWALHKVGEAGRDRPRLLDFIREQDIIVGLQAKNREEALRTLVDHLFKTHEVQSKKDEFLKRLIERNRVESSCLGGGLMIPHGRVRMGDDVAGVIGLSAKGFDWDTPDGRPVHAIVLLATPERHTDRHLQILAAFAKAITSDRNIRDILYHAKTAAHAYDILHAEESEDFNYFLEDALADDTEVSKPERV